MKLSTIAKCAVYALFVAIACPSRAQDREIVRQINLINAGILQGGAAGQAAVQKAAGYLLRTTPDALAATQRAEIDSALSADEPNPPEPVELSPRQIVALRNRYNALTRGVQAAAGQPLAADQAEGLIRAVRRLNTFLSTLQRIAACTNPDQQRSLVATALNQP